jgi:pilus assembly protein CpaC
MADKPVEATRRSWSQFVGVPRITLAAILVITVIFAACWRKPSIDANEKDQPKTGSREEVRVSTSSTGPRKSNGVAELLSIRNIPKKESTKIVGPAQSSSPEPIASGFPLKAQPDKKAPPMPDLFAEPLNTQRAQASPSSPPQHATKATVALAPRPLSSLDALRQLIHTRNPIRPPDMEIADLELKRKAIERLTILRDEPRRPTAVRNELVRLLDIRNVLAKGLTSNRVSDPFEPVKTPMQKATDPGAKQPPAVVSVSRQTAAEIAELEMMRKATERLIAVREEPRRPTCVHGELAPLLDIRKIVAKGPTSSPAPQQSEPVKPLNPEVRTEAPAYKVADLPVLEPPTVAKTLPAPVKPDVRNETPVQKTIEPAAKEPPTVAKTLPAPVKTEVRNETPVQKTTDPGAKQPLTVAKAARGSPVEWEELELRRQEVELLTVFGEEHPRVIAVRTRLAQLTGGQDTRAKRASSHDGSEQSEPRQPVKPEVRIEVPPPVAVQPPPQVQSVPLPIVPPPSAIQPSKQVQSVPLPIVEPLVAIQPPKQVQPLPMPAVQPPAVVSHQTEVVEAAPKPAPEPIDLLPKPRPVAPMDAAQVGPLPVEIQPAPLGAAPHPTAKELEEFGKYIKGFGDPTNTLDLIKGRSRLMMLKATPKRIQISDESIASTALFGATELTILGKTQGTTVLNLWFPSAEDKNKDVVLSYLVRVFPDPAEKQRLIAMLKALELDINRTFHDSVIHLQLVGDKVVVTGQAHDIRDATEILKVVVANTQTTFGGQGTQGNTTGVNQNRKQVPTENVENVPRPEQPNATQGATPGQENYLPSGSPNVINMMDIPGVQQVMLKVVVAEVNRTAARSIGLNFSVANNQGTQVFQNLTGGILTSGANGAGTIAGAAGNGLTGISPIANLPVALSNGQVSLAINALKSMHYAKSLAEPNLVANNGHTASFEAGGQFPIPVVTGNAVGGLQGVSFVKYGVQLSFTPYITDKNRIRLNVSATVSTRDTNIGTNIGNSTVPGLNARNFTSTIDLREGQTLAVAGLLQTNVGADRDQLPFLGEIPFINRFTGFDRISAGEQELVILITPELVQPMKKGAPIPRLPGSDLFEPSDLEFYLLGRLEGRRMTDFRSPVMNDFHRIQQYNRCEQTYIFGPSGYVNPTNVAK